MGGGHYDEDVAGGTRATGNEHFTYRGHDVSSVKATRSEERKCHKDLSPSKSNRECRDNPDHPQTTPIVVGLDVTRSRGNDAKIVFEKLPMFFGQICLKGYVPDPTISFSAVGDATFGDLAPVQIGQFEADNRLDEVLSHVWLEEGGGGTGQESYQLLAYYYARHCLLDSWEKRQKKGFFFMSGDEGFYPQVNKGEVARVFGDKLSEDIASQQIFRELQEKFHTFLIYPRSSWQERQADIDEEIRQRVLRAGGRVEGVDVRFSLVWHNRNDLDLHVITPSNFEIYYGNKKSPCGGELDVDMNIQGETTKPVENVRWVKNKAPKGTYRVFVQNYGFHEGNRKETPFKVEIEINGQVQHFEGVTAKDKSGPSSNVLVGEFKFDPNQRIDVDEGQKYAGYDEKLILSQWAGVLPETNILLIDDPKAIVDLMLGVLAMVGNGSSLEQYLDDMKDRQQTPKRIAEVKKALLPLSESLKISKVTMPESVGAGRKSGSRKSKTTRL